MLGHAYSPTELYRSSYTNDQLVTMRYETCSLTLVCNVVQYFWPQLCIDASDKSIVANVI